MYNGIGLTTPRGSGTNGYVQGNCSAIRSKKNKHHGKPSDKKDLEKIKTPNVELLMHEEKKKIEIELYKLKSELIKKGELSQEEIDAKISEERTTRMKKVQEKFNQSSDSSKSKTLDDTRDGIKSHQPSEQHSEKADKFKKALGIDKEYKKHGITNDEDGSLLAFDPTVKEMLKKRKEKPESSEKTKKRRKKSKEESSDSSDSDSSSDSSL